MGSNFVAICSRSQMLPTTIYNFLIANQDPSSKKLEEKFLIEKILRVVSIDDNEFEVKFEKTVLNFMALQVSEKEKWTKGLQALSSWIKQKNEAAKQQSSGGFSWIRKITGTGLDPNKKTLDGLLTKEIEEVTKKEEIKSKKGEKSSPKKGPNQDLENQINQYIKKLEQLEEQNSTKDETIAMLLDEKKALTQNKYELMDELRAEKEYSSKVMAERDRFEKESNVALNEKFKLKAESLENENAALSNCVKELEQQKEKAERKVEVLEKNVERMQTENLSYSRQIEAIKNDKTQQALMLNQQFSEIEKLRNQVVSLEQELQDNEKYINTILPDLNKETEVNEQLRKQIEAVKDVQEKLAEEKKNSLEKSNQIADLELKIKDSELTSKDAELKATDAIADLEEVHKDREREKEEFISSLASIKDALEILVQGLANNPGMDVPQGRKEEEKLLMTFKLALKKVPEVYFVYDIYQSMREKIKQSEEKIRNVEEKLASLPITDENQISRLEKELADEKEITQSLNTQLFNAQRESTQKTQIFLEKVNEFSLQFNMLIKGMFLYNKQRRTSISFATQLENFSREYPQMKNIQELYGFLRETVKKDLDQTKTSLEQKSEEVEILREKINEIQIELENAKVTSHRINIPGEEETVSLLSLPEKEFGLLLEQLLKDLIEGRNFSEEHLSLLSKLEEEINTENSREYGKNIYILIANHVASHSEQVQNLQTMSQKDLEKAKAFHQEEIEQSKTQIRELLNRVSDENKTLNEREKEKVESRDQKKEQEMRIILKEREQLINKLKQDISNMEEFCLQFSLLFRELAVAKQLSLPEFKKREQALRSLVEAHVKVEELLRLLVLLDELKQNYRNESASVVKELQVENETLKKEHKNLEKQINVIKAENDAVKQRHFIQAQIFEGQNDAIKANKKVLAKIEEYNKILYFVIREREGDISNSNDFYTRQERKSRLKQLSDEIPELHALNELYSFLSNERVRSKPSPQKNKDNGSEFSRRVSSGNTPQKNVKNAYPMLSIDSSANKFGGTFNFKKADAEIDKFGIDIEARTQKMRHYEEESKNILRLNSSDKRSSPSHERTKNGTQEIAQAYPDQERNLKGQFAKVNSALRVTSDDLKRAVRISGYLSPPK